MALADARRGLGRQHAEERDRRRRHVEAEGSLALARHRDGQRVRAEDGRRAGAWRHKLRRIGQGEADQTLFCLPLRVERELAGTRRRVVGAHHRHVVFERFVRMGLSKFADHSIGADIAAFFQTKDTSAYERALVIVADSIRTNANYKERDEKQVLKWLQEHGYA